MVTPREQYRSGKLTARPGARAVDSAFRAGAQQLGLDRDKDGLLFLPQHYHPDRPAALALMLHGAGGSPEHGLSLLLPYAEENNIILLAPASRQYSWDIIASRSYGPDVIFLDQAMQLAFDHFAIDPKRVAIGGFSDGASYALCLGLVNGDLFTHILAFSPGFAHAGQAQGAPAVFISHGTKDRMLPIEPCSRRIVPQLQRQGLTVSYTEFLGEHEIPVNVSTHAVAWFMGSPLG